MSATFIFKVWSKISRTTRSLARSYILFILYRVVFPVIALAGSKMVLQKTDRASMLSKWNETSDKNLVTHPRGKNWLIHYLSWTLRRENLWALFLLPFIVLLSATEESSDMPSPESLMIYTLF